MEKIGWKFKLKKNISRITFIRCKLMFQNSKYVEKNPQNMTKDKLHKTKEKHKCSNL